MLFIKASLIDFERFDTMEASSLFWNDQTLRSPGKTEEPKKITVLKPGVKNFPGI